MRGVRREMSWDSCWEPSTLCECMRKANALEDANRRTEYRGGAYTANMKKLET